jgi:hypothetical protein
MFELVWLQLSNLDLNRVEFTAVDAVASIYFKITLKAVLPIAVIVG